MRLNTQSGRFAWDIPQTLAPKSSFLMDAPGEMHVFSDWKGDLAVTPVPPQNPLIKDIPQLDMPFQSGHKTHI